MKRIPFKAYVVANEIDLNRIAASCDLPQKYTWEEPLVLRGKALADILDGGAFKESAVYIFSFGSMVFVNLPAKEEEKVFRFFARIGHKGGVKEFSRYQDDYELRIGPGKESEEQPAVTDQYVLVEQLQPFHIDLIAMVIAKSVALEKIEEKLMEIMGALEPLIDQLEQGKLRVRDKKLARLSSQIARFEYITLAYIMLLDKPDVTWAHSEAFDFYDLMAEFFELSDRYTVLKQKTELLNNIVENISSTSHTVKSTVIEMMVLALIAVEVVIMLVELLM